MRGRSSPEKPKNGLLFWFCFLTAFPVPMLGANLSLIIFILLLFQAVRENRYLIKFNRIEVIPALLFMAGAILSYVYSINQTNSFAVLPNYLYWAFLVLFFLSHSKIINYSIISRGVFFGLVTLIAYYFLFQPLGIFPSFFFKKVTPNLFSFLLICFAPLTLSYLRSKYSNRVVLVAGFFLVFVAFLSGSRAGSLIVLGEFFLFYYFKSLRFSQVFISLVVILLVYFVYQASYVKNLVYYLNPRVYELVYNFEEVQKEDRSYLVRIAMVEKGLDIFSDHPMYGVGLNNFKEYEADILGNFEGSQYVINKKSINTTSSHNSYVNLLAEGGLALFIPFILILISPFYYFLRYRSYLNNYQYGVFFGFLGMTIHFYAITSIVNVFAWVLIAFSLSLKPDKL